MKLYTCYGEYGSIIQVIAENVHQARALMTGSYAYHEDSCIHEAEIQIGVTIDSVGDA